MRVFIFSFSFFTEEVWFYFFIQPDPITHGTDYQTYNILYLRFLLFYRVPGWLYRKDQRMTKITKIPQIQQIPRNFTAKPHANFPPTKLT